MSDIPSELHVEILKLVPAHHLLPLKLVCKEWRSIINSFVSPASLLIRKVTADETTGNGKSKIYLLNSSSIRTTENQNGDDDDDGGGVGIATLTNIKNVIRSGVPVVTEFPLPACHGLILIPSRNDKINWAVWSPFDASGAASLHSIPATKFMKLETAFLGLGYDASTSDYKVARVARVSNTKSLQTSIYSLKSKTWRRIQDFPHVEEWIGWCYYGFQGVFMWGALHWIARLIGNAHWMIVALDLSSESFHMLPLPLSVSTSPNMSKYLDVLGENLFLSCNGGDGKSVWILKDYGGENKWTRLASFKPEPIDRFNWYNNPMRPVAYLKSKEQLILHYDWNKLMWLDVEKEEFVKKVTVKGFEEHGFSCQQMPARFAWLNGTCQAADESNALNRTKVSKRKRADVAEFEISVCKRPKSWTGN